VSIDLEDPELPDTMQSDIPSIVKLPKISERSSRSLDDLADLTGTITQ